MFRFTIRDMLWLTAVVGLALVWRVENQARHSSLEVLNRNMVVADDAALAGRWEVLEITANGKTEDFRGKKATQFSMGDAYWQEWSPDDQPISTGEWMVVRPGEINIDTTGVPGFTSPTKWRYKLQDGKLWMIRSTNPAERPTDFDAKNDPGLTLYLLRKLELGHLPSAPATQPQPVPQPPQQPVPQPLPVGGIEV